MTTQASMSAREVAERVRAAKSWLVRSGDSVVGPVSIELIERGIAAGKIPDDAQMAHVDGGAWRPVAVIFGAPTAPPEVAVAPGTSDVVESETPQGTPTDDLPASVRYPEEPISIPRHGMLAALFS